MFPTIIQIANLGDYSHAETWPSVKFRLLSRRNGKTPVSPEVIELKPLTRFSGHRTCCHFPSCSAWGPNFPSTNSYPKFVNTNPVVPCGIPKKANFLPSLPSLVLTLGENARATGSPRFSTFHGVFSPGGGERKLVNRVVSLV